MGLGFFPEVLEGFPITSVFLFGVTCVFFSWVACVFLFGVTGVFLLLLKQQSRTKALFGQPWAFGHLRFRAPFAPFGDWDFVF